MKYYLVVIPAFHKVVFKVDSFFLIRFNENKDEINPLTPERGADLEGWRGSELMILKRSLILFAHLADELVSSETESSRLLEQTPPLRHVDFFCHLVVSLLRPAVFM